ncbi:MAG: family 10 glycosylhydrolase [Bacteroidales bacterium]|nr:family 10 glycosylhydrolase [Bacteroidales bacterium]
MRTPILKLMALAVLFTACAKPAHKPRIVWIEAGASSEYYFESQENIFRDCKRIKEAGFTDVVVDVRPTSGDVLFKSSVAPELRQIAKWSDHGHKYTPREATFDYLETWIKAGHKAGLKIHAGVNMMVGGWWSESAGPEGMVYDHPERKEWCAVDLLKSGELVNFADNTEKIGGRFLDPANKEVQAFLIQMLRDLAAYKGLDGMVLDRCRYDDYAMDAGYTQAAYDGFTAYLGHEPERWPALSHCPGHVFIDWDPDQLDVQWLTYRCKVIHDFVADARAAVKKVAPKLQFAVYVGAWFSEYYRSGVNWTSPRYNLAQEEKTFWWATPEYQATGFADLFDFMILGAYGPADDVHGDKEWTMEGFAKLGRKRLCGDVPFAVGPDIGNGKGFEKGGRADVLPEIAETILNEADGLFIFDLCHIRKFDYWDAFK